MDDILERATRAVSEELRGATLNSHAMRRVATAALKGASVDPGLLRWCRWPGCMEHFVALGPVERGWMQRGHGSLECPRHAPLGHWPGWAMNPDDGRSIIATCTCRASEPVPSGIFHEADEWWDRHVAALEPVST